MPPGINNSLKVRITTVAGVLFLAGVALIALFATHVLQNEMQDRIFQEQTTTVDYLSRDIGSKLLLRRESLKRVALHMPTELFSRPAALQKWLENDRKAIHTLFPNGLLILPPDGGEALADTLHLATRPKDFADRAWFRSAVHTLEPVISAPLITRATEEAAVVVAVPILDSQNRLLGILAGITPLDAPGFLDQLRAARPSDGLIQIVSLEYNLSLIHISQGIVR